MLAENQLSLFASLGEDRTPVGLSTLTRRQQAFALHYLASGLVTESARRAGYADPESEGSKALKNPTVAAFLAKATEHIAKDADALVRRVYQRSEHLHHELQEVRQALVTQRGLPVPVDKDARAAHLAELTHAEVRERWLYQAAERQDSLLASLLGKLQLKVTGEFQHQHIQLTPAALADLRQARQAALEWSRGGITGAN